MAQKFLPSRRKGLDYEAVFTEVSLYLFYTCPRQRSGGLPERFLVILLDIYLGGRKNAEVFYV